MGRAMASGVYQRLGCGWVRRLLSSEASSGRSTATASQKCPAAGLPWNAWLATSGESACMAVSEGTTVILPAVEAAGQRHPGQKGETTGYDSASCVHGSPCGGTAEDCQGEPLGPFSCS